MICRKLSFLADLVYYCIKTTIGHVRELRIVIRLFQLSKLRGAPNAGFTYPRLWLPFEIRRHRLRFTTFGKVGPLSDHYPQWSVMSNHWLNAIGNISINTTVGNRREKSVNHSRQLGMSRNIPETPNAIRHRSDSESTKTAHFRHDLDSIETHSPRNGNKNVSRSCPFHRTPPKRRPENTGQYYIFYPKQHNLSRHSHDRAKIRK